MHVTLISLQNLSNSHGTLQVITTRLRVQLFTYTFKVGMSTIRHSCIQLKHCRRKVYKKESDLMPISQIGLVLVKYA